MVNLEVVKEYSKNAKLDASVFLPILQFGAVTGE